eukprot:TRINITY_DN5465_c0_g4_i1.p1 TRINITY_DN5465_c0_g4~~TRINITY_DN5465_c0_g4_i1.p1  ORF type:complete len:209 (+),score=-28.33 TRINITY_DN5465_c0_g4_i1:175-801(+)
MWQSTLLLVYLSQKQLILCVYMHVQYYFFIEKSKYTRMNTSKKKLCVQETWIYKQIYTIRTQNTFYKHHLTNNKIQNIYIYVTTTYHNINIFHTIFTFIQYAQYLHNTITLYEIIRKRDLDYNQIQKMNIFINTQTIQNTPGVNVQKDCRVRTYVPNVHIITQYTNYSTYVVHTVHIQIYNTSGESRKFQTILSNQKIYKPEFYESRQ